jgi:hypothetical protein
VSSAEDFDEWKHRGQIEEWSKKRGCVWTSSKRSTYGYIVPGVAAGWLYVTDGDFCIAEGLISNPDASSGARHEAFWALQEAFEDRSRQLGKQRIIGLLASDAMQAQAVDKGYKVLGVHLLIQKELS